MGSESGAGALPAKLDDVMKRRREVCAEFESHPVATTADATCAIKNGYSWNPTCDISQKRQTTTDTQLQSLLSERRGRCKVLESNPAPVVADALWNQTAEGPAQAHQEACEACKADVPGHGPGPDCGKQEPQQVEVGVAATTGTFGPPEVEASPTSSILRRETSCKPLRLSSWLDALEVAGPASNRADPSAKASCAAARLTELFQSLPDQLTSGLSKTLAQAFVSKHLAFLSFEQDHIDAIILIYLRYHCPAMLPRLVGTEPATRGMGLLDHTASTVLDLLLGRPLMPGASPQEGFASISAVLKICDEAVRSGSETVLLFVIVAVLANPGMASPSDSGSALLLWSSAQCMLAATPLSMLGILSGAEARDHALRLPVGSVAPDEVLHHVYERPAGEWRLVVVDIRDPSLPGLPVCLRLPATANFEEFTARLPIEQAIHICVLADDPLEALKLCLRLSGHSSTCRPHISLAEGGWQAVEGLALALGLELLPDATNSPAQEVLDMDGSAQSIAGTVAEVAEQVASLTSVAAAVAFKGAFWATGVPVTKHGSEACADEFMEL